MSFRLQILISKEEETDKSPPILLSNSGDVRRSSSDPRPPARADEMESDDGDADVGGHGPP